MTQQQVPAAPVQSTTIQGKKQKSSIKSRMSSGSGGAMIGLIGLFMIFSLTTPGFFSSVNLVNIVDQITVLGILAIGATAIIISGGIDLSVGSVMGLSAMTLGWLSKEADVPMIVAMLAAVGIGALAGLFNGLGVTILGLPPFIATLAMMSIARGAANMITDGQQIVGFPEWYYTLASGRYFGFLSATVIVFIILAVIAGVVMKYHTVGRKVYAIGGNPEVARLAGIKVRQTTAWVYIAAGALAGIAAVVYTSRLDAAQPTAGTGYELNVIAAVVIGGASLTGGTGRITGTIIGVLIIGVLNNGLNLLGISPFMQQVVIGAVIAVAVAVDVIRRRTR